ncbi:hypothetical protein JCM11491_002334 [Sporobolomyces phaffii]
MLRTVNLALQSILRRGVHTPARARLPNLAEASVSSLAPSALSALRLDFIRAHARTPTEGDLAQFLPQWLKRQHRHRHEAAHAELERTRLRDLARARLDDSHEWERQQCIRRGIARTPAELRKDQQVRNRIDARLADKRDRERQRELERWQRMTTTTTPSTSTESAPRPVPEWKKHKQAIQERFPGGWAPPKRISREAMDLVRTLHRTDPATHSVPELSDRFKISPEAVRRVLKSRFELPKAQRDAREARRKDDRARDVLRPRSPSSSSSDTWSGDRARERGEMQQLRDRRNDRRE